MQLALWFLGAGALAQGVPNGDFDDGLAGWRGSDLREGRDEDAPSPDAYGVLQVDDDDGWIESSAFVVTRHALDWHAQGARYDWILLNGGDRELSGDAEPLERIWRRTRAQVSSLCGATVVFRAEARDDEVTVGFDAFALVGTVCPDFVDEDGDGACSRGVDLDGDGTCVGEGEVSDEVVDCDDRDAAVGPDAEERIASGVDEDCDGLEACYEDADLDGRGEEMVVLTAALGCDEPGVAPRPDDVCPGFDDAQDADRNGVPDGCDTEDGVDGPDGPDGRGNDPLVQGRFRGGACSTGGLSTPLMPGALGLLLLLGAARRRRRG